MKEFVFLFRIKPGALTPEETLQLRAKWGNVIQRWTTEGSFVTSYLLGPESRVVSGIEMKKSVAGPVTDSSGLAAGAVIIIRANDWDEAVEISKTSPTLGIGGTVEIRELLPRPQPMPNA